MKKCWCGGEIIWPYGAPDVGAAECEDSRFHDPLADGRPKEIRRLYIAGPMSGIRDCNYPVFNGVSADLQVAGFTVVNPAEVHISGKHHYVDLIREDLRAMLDCHGVAVLDRWWESVGARNEVNVAGLLRMPVKPWREWITNGHQY